MTEGKEYPENIPKTFRFSGGHLKEVFDAINSVTEEVKGEIFAEEDLLSLRQHFVEDDPARNLPIEVPVDFIMKLFESDDGRLGSAQMLFFSAMDQESRNTISKVLTPLYAANTQLERDLFKEVEFKERVKGIVDPNSEIMLNQAKVLRNMKPLIEKRLKTSGLYEAWIDSKSGYESNLRAVRESFDRLTGSLTNRNINTDFLIDVKRNVEALE